MIFKVAKKISGGGYNLDDILKRDEPSGAVVVDGFSLTPYALYKCSNMTSLTLKNATYTGTIPYIASECTSCTSVLCLSLNNNNATMERAFSGQTALRIFDTDSAAIQKYMFYGDSALSTLVLRKSSIIPLYHNQALQNTAFWQGNAGGTIYIPESLYDHLGDGTANDYKAATSWSVFNTFGTITWAKIEGSIYETQYADGTPIS